MAFCSLPCWTYFSALARTFCLLNPNSAIEYELQPLVLVQNLPGKIPGYKSRGSSHISADGSTGQGQLYFRTCRIAWLPRVTKRECTSGLPWELGGSDDSLAENRHAYATHQCR